MAAEITDRIGYGIELDPLYVDVAVRRWQAFTGLQATHADTGATFDATAAERLAAAA
jgi:DNA modification methylase